MSSTREQIIGCFNRWFEESLEECKKSCEEQGIPEPEFTRLLPLYQTTFHHFVSTAFDSVFKPQLNDIKEEQQAEALDVSLTDDDLQALDSAIVSNCRRRKIYPSKCAHLLEKTLQNQLSAAHHIRTDIPDYVFLDRELPLGDASQSHVLRQKLHKLQSDIAESLDRCRRLQMARTHKSHLLESA